MNKLISKIIPVALGLLLTSGIIMAQDVKNTSPNNQMPDGVLTSEQVSAIKAAREKQITFRNTFRKTLTKDQIGILTNPGLSRTEKLRYLGTSLSVDQRNMITMHRKEIRAEKYTIRATFSEQQRMGIRRMAINKAQQNRIFFRRMRRGNKTTGI
jgi:hypothetical protein